ncbi:MAG: NAD(P)/FAD-dependent oxidoreductase [Clostridiales bacterium]|nr:NAD(P)/FAD-dependent oxidoreductase [Clostridiales bacterium]
MKVIVIGGGASGMICAIMQQRLNNQVVLIEKNEKLGKKIYITGKGRCNLTNDCDTEEFMQNVVNNPKFLMSSINAFSPADTMNFFEEIGLKIKVERGNRVFPLSDKSSDVIKVLQNELSRLGVEIKFNETVTDLIVNNGVVNGVITDKTKYFADKVIVATGGLSYPSTGSTGDGFKFAKSVGHTVTSLYPSLCGINLKGDDYKLLQGLTLKNVKLTAKLNGKDVYSEQGEMLFTHYGISGPLVLTCSAILARKSTEKITLSIDFKPALSEKQLDDRVLRDFALNKNKEFKNSLDGLLPKAVIPLVIKRTQIPEYKKVSIITAKEREMLVKTLKNYSFELSSLRGYNEAVITSGGVSVKEINPKTMESKIIKGLYFVGEVLDVDAFTGGFNLQIAFSTGYSAGIQE